MTVSTTADRQYFAGDGNNPIFPFNFRFFDNSQIYVYLISNNGTITGKTLNVDYTISGAMSAGGGQVVFAVPPPVGVGPYVNNVLIQRIIPQTQPTSIRNQGAFFPAIHEDVFDRLTMLIQQALYGVSNGLQLDPTLMYWDFKGRRGINAADPVNLQDVTTKNWVTQYVSGVSGAINTTNGIAYDTGTLFDYLKTGLFRSVPSMAALKLLDTTRNQRAFVQDYYAGVRGGGDPWVVDPTDTTSPDNGVTIVIGLAGARWKRVINKRLTVQDAGADMTGVVDATAIVTTYKSLFPDVIFPKGQVKLSTIIFAVGENVTFQTGASITTAAGQTVRFSGDFKSETTGRIFFGAGTIVGIRQVLPSWWGQGIGADLAALNAAQACIAASAAGAPGRPTITLSGDYILTNTWTITPYATGCISVIGSGSFDGGTRIIAAVGFPAAPVVAISGNVNPALNAVDMEIKGFDVLQAGVSSATIGIQVGSPASGSKLEGFHCNLIEDVLVQGFPICWQVIHCRLINFNRCSGWNILPSTNRISLDIRQLGGFTGDHRFTNCQFVANTGSGNISLAIVSNNGASTGSSGNMIAGIKFVGCDIYQADVKTRIFAWSGSWIADIWFIACQWDGDSNADVLMVSRGTGYKIDDVHFDNVYAAGGNLSAGNQFSLSADTGGSMSDIHFNGGCLQLAQGRTMLINLVNGVTLTGVTIRDNNNQAASAIEVIGTLRPVLVGNKLNRVTANFCKYFISLGSGLNYVMVANNLGASIAATSTINDASGAVTKTVVNNL